MIFRKLCALLTGQFSIPEGTIIEDAYLQEDLGLDPVELAMALEETFGLDPLDDLSGIDTIESLIDFLQMELDL